MGLQDIYILEFEHSYDNNFQAIHRVKYLAVRDHERGNSVLRNAEFGTYKIVQITENIIVKFIFLVSDIEKLVGVVGYSPKDNTTYWHVLPVSLEWEFLKEYNYYVAEYEPNAWGYANYGINPTDPDTILEQIIARSEAQLKAHYESLKIG